VAAKSCETSCGWHSILSFTCHGFPAAQPGQCRVVGLTLLRYELLKAQQSNGRLLREHIDQLFQIEILEVAGSFLFRRGAVEKPVAVLSGGERARLCMAGLMLRMC
jgi:ATPase subunit of ABC transporter with duplicated ATPase domains